MMVRSSCHLSHRRSELRRQKRSWMHAQGMRRGCPNVARSYGYVLSTEIFIQSPSIDVLNCLSCSPTEVFIFSSMGRISPIVKRGSLTATVMRSTLDWMRGQSMRICDFSERLFGYDMQMTCRQRTDTFQSYLLCCWCYCWLIHKSKAQRKLTRLSAGGVVS